MSETPAGERSAEKGLPLSQGFAHEDGRVCRPFLNPEVPGWWYMTYGGLATDVCDREHVTASAETAEGSSDE